MEIILVGLVYEAFVLSSDDVIIDDRHSRNSLIACELCFKDSERTILI